MKHFITILLLAIAISSIADAQECKVPISVQMRNTTTREVKNRHDKSWKNLARFFERHGFTTEIYNTRVGISLVSTEKEYYSKSKRRMEIEVRFIDTYSGNIYYSALLDRIYIGDPKEREELLNSDLAGSFPELDSLADTIHACVIDAFELSTKQVAKMAHEHALQDDHNTALFTLVQYPSCCQSYPNIQNLMVAIFRDYMNKDHEVLFAVAKGLLGKGKTEVDARFAVSLLNSVQFTGKEQEQADRLFGKIAKEYPTLDLKASEEYTYDAALKEIAVREARAIGVRYSSTFVILEGAGNFLNQSGSDNDNEDWYPEMIKVYNERLKYRDFRGQDESWWK